MTRPSPFVIKSLREQVYEHLKGELRRGALDTGSFLDLNRLAAELGVSRTPLRDALIQLEAEEFVTISPRRGVAVRSLGHEDIRELYQMIGALEAGALLAAAPGIRPEDLAALRDLDARSLRAIGAGDLDTHWEANYAFHDFFLDRQGNGRVTRLVHLKKQQLTEWNRKFEHLHAAWEGNGVREHEEILRLLEAGDAPGAAAYLRDVHWGFKVQEAFVDQVYFEGRP